MAGTWGGGRFIRTPRTPTPGIHHRLLLWWGTFSCHRPVDWRWRRGETSETGWQKSKSSKYCALWGRYFQRIHQDSIAVIDTQCYSYTNITQHIRLMTNCQNTVVQKSEINMHIHSGPQKAANLFLSVTSSKDQLNLMQFSLLDLKTNGTCDSMNCTHLD